MLDYLLLLVSMILDSMSGESIFLKELLTWLNRGENPTGDPDVDDIIPAPGSERWNITTSTSEAVPHCDVVLVTVPTPVTEDLKPDLSYVQKAGRKVFESLNRGSRTIVVLESTVYPGVTCSNLVARIGKPWFGNWSRCGNCLLP